MYNANICFLFLLLCPCAVVRTAATPVSAVQTITTTATEGASVGGSFRVTLDMTALGGVLVSSGDIAYDASATGSDRESMTEILEGMSNIGDVTVTRDGPTTEGGYTWSITFNDPAVKIPTLGLEASDLTGAGANAAFATVTEGTVIGGQFQLQVFDNSTTAAYLQHSCTYCGHCIHYQSIDIVSFIELMCILVYSYRVSNTVIMLIYYMFTGSMEAMRLYHCNMTLQLSPLNMH